MFSPILIPLNAVAERATACCNFLDGMPLLCKPVNATLARLAVDSALFTVVCDARTLERLDAELKLAQADQLQARAYLRDSILDARDVARRFDVDIATLGRYPAPNASAALLDDIALGIEEVGEPSLMRSRRWAESCVGMIAARHTLDDANGDLRSGQSDRRHRRKALLSDLGHLRTTLCGLDRVATAHLDRVPVLAAQWRAIMKGTASAMTARAA